MRHAGTLLAAVLLGAVATGCAGLSEVRLDASERTRLATTPAIHAVHYRPLRRLRVAHLGGVVETVGAAWMDLEDPVADVEAEFLAGLQRELNLTNLLPYDRPLPSPHVPARGADPGLLREVFRDGLVLDLETIAWQLSFVSRSFLDSAQNHLWA